MLKLLFNATNTGNSRYIKINDYIHRVIENVLPYLVYIEFFVNYIVKLNGIIN